MKSEFSYFLVTHGSRNPSASEFLQNLVQLAQLKCQNLVGGGLLEGHELSLSQQLCNFAQIAEAQGYAQILILPVFLIAGVHVCTDIPEQVAIAQSMLNSSVQLKIADRFGSYPLIPQLLKTKFPELSTAKILLAHGSRLPETTVYLENLAQKLKAIPAYWSIAPDIETQIELLIKQGHLQITVLPYFLSSSGILEAIATKISSISTQAQINLLELPFDPDAIANLVMEYALIFKA
jgi:sirohydrochlorin cobaltochelatase